MATTPSRRAAALASFLLVCVAHAAGAEDFRFSKLDRTYSQFVEELTPLVMGPVTILLSSPEHQLTLEQHGVQLTPAPDGSHQIRLHVVFTGFGLLDADLDMAGVKGQLADELTLPRQRIDLEGRVGIEKSDEGWLITIVERPEQVEVRIQSRMAGRIVPFCRQMALVLVRFDCEALEQSLSRIQVPLPAPGEVFLLPREDLTDAEAEALDAYLGLGEEVH